MSTIAQQLHTRALFTLYSVDVQRMYSAIINSHAGVLSIIVI